MTLFDDLKSEVSEDWEHYTRHEFVERLGDGSLPLAAFQDYLVQDYLFLIQFARASALAAFKGRTLAEIRRAASELSVILSETDLHVRLTERWGIGLEELTATPEKPGTVAYTRYVLDCGQVGDLLDLSVALAPCAVGYAEIGRRLAPVLEQNPEHPYREWIAEYAGEPFQEASRQAIAFLDELSVGGLPERRRDQLVTEFRTATRMESAFWQQALEVDHP